MQNQVGRMGIYLVSCTPRKRSISASWHLKIARFLFKQYIWIAMAYSGWRNGLEPNLSSGLSISQYHAFQMTLEDN